MTRGQKRAVIAGTLALLLAAAFPPWCRWVRTDSPYVAISNYRPWDLSGWQVEDYGLAWIGALPQARGDWECVEIDFATYNAELFAGALATTLTLFLLRGRRRVHAPSAAQ